MATDNPTKTRGIEKAWNREINKRFSEFRKSVIGELRQLNQLTVNQLELDADQINRYIEFFLSELDRLIIGDWQEKYQERAYQLALDRTNQEAKRQGALITDDEDRSALELTALLALFSSTSGTIFNTVHQETLAFLFTRAFEALTGLSQEMARRVRMILVDGVAQGLGVNELSRQIQERINVGRSRARLIAQTETIQAFQRAVINQSLLIEESTGVDNRLKWDDSSDNRVRELHVFFDQKIFTRKQAFININISPFRCRCSLVIIFFFGGKPVGQGRRIRVRTLTGR